MFDAEKVGETLMHIPPAQAAHQIAEAVRSRRERRTTWADG
jgi:hypothetical protein